MKSEFKLSPLAIMVAASISLMGCNTESDTASIDSSLSTLAETTSASVVLAATFPEPEAGAAWIGSASEIEVRFYRNEYVGSLDEAEDMVDAMESCSYYDDYNSEDTFMIGDEEVDCDDLPDDGLKERLALETVLDADSPTTSVDLVPGKFRVEASIMDAQGELRETSVSYVTLTDGEHQISLKGVSATWTAETPLSLALLNQAGDIDWDPEEDGVQTPADVLDIDGDILGLHLPSLYTYSGDIPEYEDDWLDWGHPVVLAGSDDIEGTNQATLMAPVWRIETDTGEKDLYPGRDGWDFYEDSDYYDETTTEDQSYMGWTSYLGALYQEYADGTNQTRIELGSKEVALWEKTWSEDDESFDYSDKWAMVLFGIPETEDDMSDDDGERNSYNSYTISYWDSEQGTDVDTGITVVDISTWEETDSFADAYFNVLEGSSNTFSDGSTINGYLIEIIVDIDQEEEDGRVEPTPFFYAALEEIAVQDGLTAAASSECQTVTESSVSYSNQYRWDKENSRWVAGVENPLSVANSNVLTNINTYLDEYKYQVEIGTADTTVQEYITQLENARDEFNELTDLNGDGEVDFFEDGVFIDDLSDVACYLDINWSSETQETTYSLSCNIEELVVQDVESWSNSWEGEMCVQPFTLTASELAIEYDSSSTVTID